MSDTDAASLGLQLFHVRFCRAAALSRCAIMRSSNPCISAEICSLRCRSRAADNRIAGGAASCDNNSSIAQSPRANPGVRIRRHRSHHLPTDIAHTPPHTLQRFTQRPARLVAAAQLAPRPSDDGDARTPHPRRPGRTAGLPRPGRSVCSGNYPNMTAPASTSNSGPAPAGVSGGGAARDPLARFPSEVRAAHRHYQATGDPAAADTVVLAVIRDFVPRKAGVAADRPLPDDARLMQDLGYDSLAIAETVFFLEDLYPVTIRNEEILELSTVGDLRAFVRRKLAQANDGRR